MVQYMHSEKCRPHSNTIAPLRALIRLHARFAWTRECHSVFEELNRKSSHKTMLVLEWPIGGDRLFGM